MGSTPMDCVGSCAEKEAEAPLHLVMVPYPLHGHANPMLQFAKMLVSKRQGVSVTFVTSKHFRDRILGHATSSSNLQFLCLDDGGLPPDFDYLDLSVDGHEELHIATAAMKDPFRQLLQSMINQNCRHVSCVLFDSFCLWAHSVAAEFSIPSVFFWTQSTSVFAVYYHWPLLVANGFFPYDKRSLAGHIENGSDGMVSYIPGVPPIPSSGLPTFLRVDDLSDPLFAFIIREPFSIFEECKGVIINSFEELEREACEAVRAELPVPLYLVGPLIASSFLNGSDQKDTTVRASFLEGMNECIGWLDCQRKRSVLYVSFGTVFNPSYEDLETIAGAIKGIKQPFLWVIRPRSSHKRLCDMLPKHFLEDTKDYGLIIPWAPQLQVLSHPSTGAFMTHCGWNSTLESLSRGVPLIPLPIFTDQPTNCTYTCDFWKVGMSLKGHSDDAMKVEDVERVVRTVLHEEEGNKMRKRATRFKEAARQALLTGGLSNIDIESFIRAMKTQAM